VRRRQADVFVEVEGGDAAEIEALLAVHADQLLIEAQRGAAGGEAEHGVGFFPNDAGDDLGAEDAANVGIFADEDFHGANSSRRHGPGRQAPTGDLSNCGKCHLTACC
jgi:hypothetical protein